MNTPIRVVGFAAGLAAVFAAALGVGMLTGPVVTAGASSTARPNTPPEPHGHSSTDDRTGTDDHAGGDDHAGRDDHAGGHDPADPEASGSAADVPGGLLVSQDGYTLALAQREVSAAAKVPLHFVILGPDGQPVTRYDTAHGKDLHLIAVRRDLTGYQHVHPELDAAGAWRVPLDLSKPGGYRLFADFTPSGRDDNLTLGADLSVAGDYRPQPLPAPTRTAEVDGYTVTLDGTLEAGQEAELTLTVSKDGRPVSDLQPYLEAYGHLVALRDRDLAYLHVHPAGSPGDGKTRPGPGITFYAKVPSAGDYRLFLDFRHGDRVRTAAFTVTAGAR